VGLGVDPDEVDLDDVGVNEVRGGPRLAPEALLEARLGSEAPRQDFTATIRSSETWRAR